MPVSLIGTPCRNCGQRKVNRPRGLCVPCYRDDSIRGRFDVVNPKFCTRDDGDFFGGFDLAEEPTGHRPGTEEKMAVMRGRAEAKVQLFHPKDF